MTYTIYIHKSNLNWDMIHKADKIGGMIEQVLPNLISWHDLKENEIEPALNFIRETWGGIKVELCKEIYHGSCVDTPLEKKIDLSKEDKKEMSQKIFDAEKANKAQEEYCKIRKVPHFAPQKNCYYCGQNIYAETGKLKNGGTWQGISVERAGNEHITGCPFCSHTYCD